MTALLNAPPRRRQASAPPVRSSTRRRFVSRATSSRPNAKAPSAAAVYGPTPGQRAQVLGPAVARDHRGASRSRSARRL
jgi:hypothetical protein